MEEGNLRCDANVSLRPEGGGEYGTQTEIKNVNSFKFVEQALAFEIARQGALLDAGGEVTHDTLLWDETRGAAHIMRSKEESHDYRYFPEPDLLVLKTSDSMVDEIAASLPELPDAREQRFVDEYGLPAYDAGVLTGSCELAAYYEAAAKATGDPKTASNWVMGEVFHELNERKIDIDEFPVSPSDLGVLLGILRSGTINTPTAKEVFRQMLESGEKAADIIAAKGLEQITDREIIGKIAKAALDDNPAAVEKYLKGKEKLLKFFVGQVMKETGGRVNPGLAEEILKTLLEKRQI
jgi:aspartyl-tRNA(Asn)/glutamyl-tRNA(Gln) amidotransferase subunit B